MVRLTTCAAMSDCGMPNCFASATTSLTMRAMPRIGGRAIGEFGPQPRDMAFAHARNGRRQTGVRGTGGQAYRPDRQGNPIVDWSWILLKLGWYTLVYRRSDGQKRYVRRKYMRCRGALSTCGRGQIAL